MDGQMGEMSRNKKADTMTTWMNTTLTVEI